MVTEPELEGRVREFLLGLGESVSIHYEPRNEPEPWTVSLTREPMIHGHFETLVEGLEWLRDQKPRFSEWERQIAADRDS